MSVLLHRRRCVPLLTFTAIVSTHRRDGSQIPFTYYSLQYQDQFGKNAAAIKGTPYEAHFKPDLFVYPETIEPGRKEMDCNTQALKGDFSDINTLLAPASTTLASENGWCHYEDGRGYVASRTHFPSVTPDMISWWFWWHSKESVRYSLWHPWAHEEISSTYADKFDDPSLNNTQKLIGSIHHVKEIIGHSEQSIDIHWQRPSYFKLDESKFEENGIAAAACGEIYLQGTPVKAVDMIHLWYKTDNGLELRSRYFLANNIQLRVPILGQLFPLDQIASLLGLKKAIVGRDLAHEQVSCPLHAMLTFMLLTESVTFPSPHSIPMTVRNLLILLRFFRTCTSSSATVPSNQCLLSLYSRPIRAINDDM